MNFWNISHFIFFDGFGDLIDLLRYILWGRSAIRKVIFYSEISVGAYYQLYYWGYNTSWIVRCGQENSTGCFPFTNDMRSSRCRQDSILSINQFGYLVLKIDYGEIYSIGSSQFSNDLHDFFVVVTTISANYEGGSFCSRRRNCLKNSLQ
jgi:hypothetical protein